MTARPALALLGALLFALAGCADVAAPSGTQEQLPDFARLAPTFTLKPQERWNVQVNSSIRIDFRAAHDFDLYSSSFAAPTGTNLIALTGESPLIYHLWKATQERCRSHIDGAWRVSGILYEDTFWGQTFPPGNYSMLIVRERPGGVVLQFDDSKANATRNISEGRSEFSVRVQPSVTFTDSPGNPSTGAPWTSEFKFGFEASQGTMAFVQYTSSMLGAFGNSAHSLQLRGVPRGNCGTNRGLMNAQGTAYVYASLVEALGPFGSYDLVGRHNLTLGPGPWTHNARMFLVEPKAGVFES